MASFASKLTAEASNALAAKLGWPVGPEVWFCIMRHGRGFVQAEIVTEPKRVLRILNVQGIRLYTPEGFRMLDSVAKENGCVGIDAELRNERVTPLLKRAGFIVDRPEYNGPLVAFKVVHDGK